MISVSRVSCVSQVLAEPLPFHSLPKMVEVLLAATP